MLALLCGGLTLQADDSADVHHVIGDLAEALSGDEPTQAMSYFSKKCPAYDKLRGYFEALTSAFYVENRVEFPDEQVSATTATITVQWDLALTTQQTGFTKNRKAEITIKLAHEGKHWRIVDFSPTDLFDPQA